jgi:predicted nucleic acid-binding protein
MSHDAGIAALAPEPKLPVLTRDSHLEVVPRLQRKGW